MKTSRIIGIFGCEQTDICIYLASILENMKKHVLVIDNSFEQKMRFCIPRPEEKLKLITYKDVDYISHCETLSFGRDEYDYVIVNFGTWPEEAELELCNELICVMNCEISQIRNYREMLEGLKRPISILFRNYCKNYMDSTKITKQLGETSCFVVERIFLPFSELDECIRIMMQAEGYQNFAGISREFEKVLFHLCRTICEDDYAKVLSGIRRAKRGECF